MKINERLLRSRRLQLGLTSREVAKRANVTMTLVKRLETTGEIGTLQVQTVTALLDALGLELSEVVLPPQIEGANDQLVAAIGCLIQERGRGVMSADIASSVGCTLDKVEPALQVLDAHLRPSGLRIHRSSSGISIVPLVRLDAGSGSLQEVLRYLSNINNGDIVLVHRLLTEEISERSIAMTTNGNVSLHKITGSGLVETNDGQLATSPLLNEALYE